MFKQANRKQNVYDFKEREMSGMNYWLDLCGMSFHLPEQQNRPGAHFPNLIWEIDDSPHFSFVPCNGKKMKFFCSV